MQLRLSNGTQINLNDLDKLENKSTDNDFLKFFDGFKLGGNGNNIFDKKEIEKIKKFLISMAGSDGVIDQNDIKNAHQKYESIFKNYGTLNMADDLSILQLSQKSGDIHKKLNNANDNTVSSYKVKSGDTLDKIVASLGYKGNDAKKYVEALDKQLAANGSYMNDKKWLMAGDTISLLSKKILNELGIKKSKVEPVKLNKCEENLPDENESNALLYKVKSGDTLAKIAASLGYRGNDAKKYVEALDKQLTASGSYMNDKKWLMAGNTINLLSEKTLNELGIKKSTVKSDRQLSSNDGNNEDGTAVKKKFKNKQEAPVNDDDNYKIVNNSPQRILNLIKQNGQKGRIVDGNSLTGSAKRYISIYEQGYKTKPVYIKNDSTSEVHVFFDLTKSRANALTGMTSAEYVIKDNMIKTYRNFKNGKIVLDKEDLNDKKHKVYSTLIQKPKPGKPKSKKQIMTALPITINVNPQVYEGASEEEKEEINSFLNTLKSQKTNLMKDLNIDNDTYNELAHLSCAIAMQESGFGTSSSYAGEDKLVALKDTVAGINIGLEKIGIKNPINSSTAVSKGLTQIKIGDWDDSPKIAKLFKKYGINNKYGANLNGEQSAAATIIILNEVRKRAQGQTYKDAAEMANGRYYYSDAKLVNGKRVERKGGYLHINKVTNEDVMLYIYNGRGSLRRGDATPSTNIYTHNVARYKKLFTIVENAEQRKQALKDAPVVTEQTEKRIPMSKDLSWGIGQVAFQPKIYAGGVSKNTNEEINKLKEFLTARNYNIKDVNRLISKMQNGELCFANGLKNSEMNMITEDDVKLLIAHSDKLNFLLGQTSDVKSKRNVAMQADKDFKREYLSSHARQYFINDIENNTVILNDGTDNSVKKYPKNGYNTGAQKRCKKYLTQLRSGRNPDGGLYLYEDRINKGLYTGFNVERDKGINFSNSSDINILLAQNGADASNTLRTSGGCLTGAKQALIGSGAVSDTEMRTFNNAFQLAKFLEKHPDRFQEIKYVQISDNVAREITAGDLTNLPAGYIVVFGNKHRNDVPGHAAITSGNGQLYADEIDNSNWDNFVAQKFSHNGKGEHGYVRIFRLNPDYFRYDMAVNKVVKK